MDQKKKDPLLRHPAMKILENAIRKEIQQQLLASCFLLFTGLIMGILGLGRSVFFFILGLGVSGISLALIVKSIRQQNIEQNTIFRALHDHPESLVWVYAIVTERMPFGLKFWQYGLLYFHTLDGKHHTISVPVAKLKLLSKYLNRLLPSATFGYSLEKEELYRDSPLHLLRNGGELLH